MADVFHMIVATDNGLYVVRPDGVSGQISQATIPDVSIRPGVPARFAVLRRSTVLVNAVSQPIWIAPDATPHPLTLTPPATAPTIAAGGGTGLTGAYKVRVSYLMKDGTGNVLAESPLGPESSSTTLANQNLSITAIPISGQVGVTARRLYRTATGGSAYFHLLDVDDNVTTGTITDGAADAALSLVAAPDSTDLGTAPSRLTNVCEWKSRLWGVAANLPDTLYATAQNSVTAWPLTFEVLPVGADTLGISGFLPRRDDLGICKRNILWKVVGDGPSNFALKKVKEGVGCTAPDSCKVVGDIGYFLGGSGGNVSGVYAWSGDGVSSITDDSVRAWFTTDTYFNRALFGSAVAAYNPSRDLYILFLASAGSSVLDRWVAYDLTAQHWMGPHKTATFTPSAAFLGQDGSGNHVLVTGGSNGQLYRSADTTFTDGASDAIDFDIKGKFHAGDPPDPDTTHQWLQPTIFTKADVAGTLTVTPRVGGLGATAGSAQTVDLTKEKTRLARLGPGRLCQLEIRQNTAGQGVEVYGYQIPYNDIGRRGSE